MAVDTSVRPGPVGLRSKNTSQVRQFCRGAIHRALSAVTYVGVMNLGVTNHVPMENHKTDYSLVAAQDPDDSSWQDCYRPGN